MAETTVSKIAARQRFEDDRDELRLAKARDIIRKNSPAASAALHWRRDSPSRMVSTDGRFSVDKHGEGDAVRYTAKLQPNTIIGHRRFTLQQAQEDCCRHASPLPLEQPAINEPVEREPGSDDE